MTSEPVWETVLSHVLAFLGLMTPPLITGMFSLRLSKLGKSVAEAGVNWQQDSKNKHEIRLADLSFATGGVCVGLIAIVYLRSGHENTWFLSMNADILTAALVSAVLVVVLSCYIARMLKGESGSSSTLMSWCQRALYMMMMIFCASFAYLDLKFSFWQQLQWSEKLAFAAWDGYQRDRVSFTTRATDTCISEFLQLACAEHDRWKSEEPPPPTGTVESKGVRDAIFKRAVTNNLATCLWIRGRTAQSIGSFTDARHAYTAAARFSYARTWDASGRFFWPPGRDAQDRLSDLPSTLQPMSVTDRYECKEGRKTQ